MSWTADRVRQPKKRKIENFQSLNKTLNFEEYVPQKYQELILNLNQEIKKIQHDILLLQQEQKEIADNPSRGLIRRKKQITSEITHLNERLTVLQSGSLIEEFKTQILPFSEAYERELQINSMEKLKEGADAQSLLPREGTTARYPTSTGTSQTTTTNTNKNDHPDLKISGVMKDFLKDVEHRPPEIKVMPNEICEECDDIMVLESRSSTLVCSCCGNWRHYLDATSSHMAYGEEVEFTAFAYLRLNHYNER